MYLNTRVAVPVYQRYVALRSVLPISSSSVGEPANTTGSEKFTAILIVAPSPYSPAEVSDGETDTT